MYNVQVYVGEAVGIAEFSTLDEVAQYLKTLPDGLDEVVVVDPDGNDIDYVS